jgi:hypothetical protein
MICVPTKSYEEEFVDKTQSDYVRHLLHLGGNVKGVAQRLLQVRHGLVRRAVHSVVPVLVRAPNVEDKASHGLHPRIHIAYESQ